MKFTFTKAVKEQEKARVALYGPSGSGKTYTALQMAGHFGERVAVIDTEHGSSAKYADLYAFDMLRLTQHDPRSYIQAIHAAEQAGYDVVIIDSLTHAWDGKGGVLEIVDRAATKYAGNSFRAWGDATPHHKALVEAILASGIHVIATMRSKTAYEVQENDRGKKEPVKLGTAPIQRDNMEYEFDVVIRLDMFHNLVIEKTRCYLLDQPVYPQGGEEIARTLAAWLSEGEAPATERKRLAYIAAIGERQSQIKALDADAQFPSDDELKEMAIDQLERHGYELRDWLASLNGAHAQEAV